MEALACPTALSPCGHVWCAACLEALLTRSMGTGAEAVCPSCRSVVHGVLRLYI